MRRDGVVKWRQDFVIEDHDIFEGGGRDDPIEAKAIGIRRTRKNSAGWISRFHTSSFRCFHGQFFALR